MDPDGQLVNSDPASVTVTVLRVAGVTAEEIGQPGQATPGQDLYVPIMITNMGNAPDVFALSVSSAKGWSVDIVYDDNADGVHQDDEQWVITTAGPMIADGYSPCFARVTVPENAASPDTVTFTAVSNYDAQGSDQARISVYMTTPPSVAITTPTDNPTYSATSPSIDLGGTASGELEIVKVEWATDHGTSGTCDGTSAWTASNIDLLPGSNVITITATDSAPRTATATLTVVYNDTTPPSVAITDPVSNATYTTNNPQLMMAGAASDNIGVTTVSWSNNRGGSGVCTGTAAWSIDLISLASGENVITVSASDASGNVGASTLTAIYSPGPLAPTVNITSPTSTATYTTNNPQLMMAGTASDSTGVTTVSWSNNRGGSGVCTGTAAWSIDLISLASGENVITVSASDAAGNVGTSTLTAIYSPDPPAPTVNITSPTRSATYTTNAPALSLAGTAAHDVGIAGVAWSNSRTGSGSCTGTTAWTAAGIPLKMGQNVIIITATSTPGSTATATLTVTRMAPAVTITGPTSAAVYSTEQTSLDLSGTASGNVAGVVWSSDHGASGNCLGTDSWTAGGIPLVLGRNVLTVTASDAIGNNGSCTLTVTCGPDTTKPAIEINTPTDQGRCSRNCPVVTIAGFASDNSAVAGVTWINATTGETGTCALSGATWSAGGISLTTGDNEIIATAADSAGNTASAVVTVNYVDATPGAAWTGMAMVSLPIVPDEIDPKVEAGFCSNMWCSFITAVGVYALYPDERSWLDPADQTPGRGFWAYFDAQVAVPYGTIPPQDQPATVHLKRGWNLVGTPFISEVAWDTAKLMVKEPRQTARAMRDATDLMPGDAWGFRQDPNDPTTGAYYLICDASVSTDDEHRMEPWRAYWIRAYRECDLIVPAPL